MLDIKLLRNNFEEVEKALSNRNEDFDLSKFKSLDDKRRELLASLETMKAEQNAVSKKVPQMKKEGLDVTAVLDEMKALSEKVKELNAEVSTV